MIDASRSCPNYSKFSLLGNIFFKSMFSLHPQRQRVVTLERKHYLLASIVVLYLIFFIDLFGSYSQAVSPVNSVNQALLYKQKLSTFFIVNDFACSLSKVQITSKMRFTNNRLTNLLVFFQKVRQQKIKHIQVRPKNKIFVGNVLAFIIQKYSITI